MQTSPQANYHEAFRSWDFSSIWPRQLLSHSWLGHWTLYEAHFVRCDVPWDRPGRDRMFLCVMASNTKIQSCKAIIPIVLLHHLYSLTGTKESSGTPVPNQDRLAAAVRGHVESQQPDLQLIGRLKETWSLPGDGLLNHNFEHVFASLQPVAVPLARDLLSVAGHMKHQCKCRRRIWPKPLQPWPLMHMEYRNLTAPSY